MSNPLFVSLPAIFAAFWSGIVAIVKWALEHAHTIKIAIVCFLVIAAFKLGHIVYSFFMQQLESYSQSINDSVPSGFSYSLALLAKANYCLPVSEMLLLLSTYAVLAGLCISLRFFISLYRSVPFKSA